MNILCKDLVENNGNGLNYCNTFLAQGKKKKMKKKKSKVMGWRGSWPWHLPI
jgi:hypothetical protein